jgi:Pentapeptide repeats (8 copies)
MRPDLGGVSLAGAKLSGANLSGANLRNANLTSANLTNAEVTNVGWQIEQMRGPLSRRARSRFVLRPCVVQARRG